MNLKDKAKVIRHEVTKYLTKTGNSCHFEVGLNKGGKLRADIYAFNYKRKSIVVEIKSGWNDFKTDSKWHNYLPYCHKLYFAVANDFENLDLLKQALKPLAVGLLIVDLQKVNSKYHSKSVKCEISSTQRSIEGTHLRDIIVRLAYRSGKLRTNKNSWLNSIKDIL